MLAEHERCWRCSAYHLRCHRYREPVPRTGDSEFGPRDVPLPGCGAAQVRFGIDQDYGNCSSILEHGAPHHIAYHDTASTTGQRNVVVII